MTNLGFEGPCEYKHSWPWISQVLQIGLPRSHLTWCTKISDFSEALHGILRAFRCRQNLHAYFSGSCLDGITSRLRPIFSILIPKSHMRNRKSTEYLCAESASVITEGRKGQGRTVTFRRRTRLGLTDWEDASALCSHGFPRYLRRSRLCQLKAILPLDG
jgi:hypothetical protein